MTRLWWLAIAGAVLALCIVHPDLVLAFGGGGNR